MAEPRLSFRGGKRYTALVNKTTPTRRLILAVITVLMLSSCLSVETEVNLRRSDRPELTMRYRMARSLWELGVFDSDSPERAVPVTRRDAEETALRHPGVHVTAHEVRVQGDIVVVEVTYRADSFAGIQGVWGEGSSGGMVLTEDADDGRSRLVIPVSVGGVGPDHEQGLLIRGMFEDEVTRITVRAPRDIADARVESDGHELTAPSLQGPLMDAQIPMSDILLHSSAVVVTVEW